MKHRLLPLIFLLISVSGYGQSNHEVGVIAITENTFCKDDLTAFSIKANTQIGNVLTLRIPISKLNDLDKIKTIKHWQVAQKVKPNLERATKDLRASQVHQGVDLPEGYTGKDVIIGVTDWGFDYTHPNFYNQDMSKTRVLAAWDQFKTSGPSPEGFGFGTEYEGQKALITAGSDTSNVYSYGTHGTHVAGIAGGNGYGTTYKGIAYNANFLFVTFLVDEAAFIDGVAWMKKKAEKYKKRLVVNMSWGLYYMGAMDGSSIINRALDEFSKEGVVFVTSAGNNGGRKFHIKKEFNGDTLRTGVQFYSYKAHKEMWGQSISMWGEIDHNFWSSFAIYDSEKKLLANGPKFETSNAITDFDSLLIINTDTIFYRIKVESYNPINQKPHIRLRIKNTNSTLDISLLSSAKKGTVHYWNVVELKNNVGNWGQDFYALKSGWERGDAKYSVGAPASGKSVISVAAHSSEYINVNGNLSGGSIASFSSLGPTVDGRIKPDVSAPGVSIASSVSSFTDGDYTSVASVSFNSKDYHYARFSGTSMSSPATSGVVALVLSANPSLTSEQVRDIIIETAREDAKTGNVKDTGSVTWGYGKVTANAAVRKALETTTAVQNPILYPNPANHDLFYGYIGSPTYSAEIFSNQGEKVLTADISNDIGIQISHLAPGLYFLKISNGQVLKFMKQ